MRDQVAERIHTVLQGHLVAALLASNKRPSRPPMLTAASGQAGLRGGG
jgi:hypothetical protein